MSIKYGINKGFYLYTVFFILRDFNTFLNIYTPGILKKRPEIRNSLFCGFKKYRHVMGHFLGNQREL
jgi:hypothetical protein